MALKKQPDKKVDFSKWNSIYAIAISACTLFGIAFGAGFYVSNTFNKIEINNMNQRHNEELYNQKIAFQNVINQITHEKNLLEIENGKLKK